MRKEKMEKGKGGKRGRSLKFPLMREKGTVL